VALSFSEASHRKGSWLVEVDEAGVQVTAVDAPVQRRLAVLRGDLEELLSDPAHAAAESAWCQVTLTDPVRPVGAMERVRRRFPHTLVIQFDPQGAPVPVRSYAQRVAAPSQLDVCCDFLAHVRGGHGPSEAELAVLTEAIEETRLDAAGRDDRNPAKAEVEGSRRRGAA
jgi:exonuclease SbcD